MVTLERANAVNNAVKWVSTMTDVEKAAEVLRWCNEMGIHNNWTKDSLAAGMSHFPYWNQGPADYLCLVVASQELYEHGHILCPNCKEEFILHNDGSIDAIIGT